MTAYAFICFMQIMLKHGIVDSFLIFTAMVMATSTPVEKGSG